VGGLVALYLHPRMPHENKFLHPQLKASGMIQDAIAHLGLPERIPLVGWQLLLR
jgi:hypothetical protein